MRSAGEEARRAAAIKSMRQFADKRGEEPVVREEDIGDQVNFIGLFADGREYGVGYMKDAAQ